MKFPGRIWLLALPIVMGSGLPAWGVDNKLTSQQFETLKSLIKPGGGEDKWEQVPWLTSLWEARRRAAALGRPIVLWEMDGHPLGCT